MPSVASAPPHTAPAARGSGARAGRARRLALPLALVAAASLAPRGQVQAQAGARIVVVRGGPAERAAVGSVLASIEGTVARASRSRRAADLAREGRAWGAAAVVSLDVGLGLVVAVRARDGRALERRLAPEVAARSPYAVAMVVAELLEVLVEPAAAGGSRARPTAPGRRRSSPVGIVVRVGPSVAVSVDGDPVVPRAVAEVGLVLRPARAGFAFVAGLVAAPGLALERDVPNGTGERVAYARHDLALSLGLWTRGGRRLALGGGALLGVALAAATARDASGAELGTDRRVLGWVGAFGSMRVRLAGGLFVGLSPSIETTPEPRRYLVRGTPTSDEGRLRLSLTLDVGWQSSDR